MFMPDITAQFIDENQRHLSLPQLAGASLGVLVGLTHTQAAAVMEALDARTLHEVANSKYVLWAQAITTLAKHERVDAANPGLAPILDEKWSQKRLRDLAQASPAVFAGLSEKEAKGLQQALGVKTIEDLATNVFIRRAQLIAGLADAARSPILRIAA
jgi:hypothetical protein